MAEVLLALKGLAGIESLPFYVYLQFALIFCELSLCVVKSPSLHADGLQQSIQVEGW